MWICVQCRSTFCDGCWDKQSAHKDYDEDLFGIGFESSGFGPHEKVTREVFQRLSKIFAGPSDSDRARAHEIESRAKWFGVCRGEGGLLYFGDTDRFTSVINDSWTGEFPDQFPNIVSFVGQTGESDSRLASHGYTPSVTHRYSTKRGREEHHHPDVDRFATASRRP